MIHTVVRISGRPFAYKELQRRLLAMEPYLQEIGDTHARVVRERISIGKDARGEQLQPLSEMTLALRRHEGIKTEAPLYETGQMIDSYMAEATGNKVIIGPSGFLSLKKAARSIASLPSSILKRRVPERNPFYFNDSEVKIYAFWLMGKLLGIKLPPLRTLK